MFILIDVPEQVIDERIKHRVICPKCQTPRNIKLLATPFPGYDEEKDEYYLMCDNPECEKAVMGKKEGDELGIETIKGRLENDDQLIRNVFNLHGVPKVYLRNAIPVDLAADFIDDYEITPEFTYEKDEEGKVAIVEKGYTVKDDNGIESYSLLAPPVVVAMVKQIVKILDL
jgi:hypothetical protein